MMLSAVNVSKSFSTKENKKVREEVLHGLNFDLPKGSQLAILGGKGSGKSTVLNMIAGLEYPDSGKIRRYGTVSWVAGGMKFERGMTITQNLRFLGRILGQKDFEATEAFVEEVTELGPKMKKTVADLEGPERQLLNYAALMAFDFDIYLFDGMKYGRPAIAKRIAPLVEEKLEHSTGIVTVGRVADVTDRITHILVLADQTGRLYESRREAYQAFKQSRINVSNKRQNAG